MGRPLNKKYFGNLVAPYTAGDTGEGGSRITAINLNAQGSGYTTVPAVTITAPQLPNGVAATYAVHMEIDTITVSGTLLAGHGYTIGPCTFTELPGVIAQITLVGSGQGETQTIDFSGTGMNRGDFTAITATTGIHVIEAGGDGNNTVTVTYRVKSVAVTNSTANQGYVPADTTTTIAGNATLNATTFVKMVATVDGYDNAVILARAFINGARKDVDILKQESSRRYRVKTDSLAPVVARLVDHASAAAGEMDITATDSDSNAYWVLKLTAHKALLVRKSAGSGQFATGTTVRWVIDTVATQNVTVVIESD